MEVSKSEQPKYVWVVKLHPRVELSSSSLHKHGKCLPVNRAARKEAYLELFVVSVGAVS